LDSPDHLRSIERTLRTAAVASAALLAAWLLRDVLLLGFASVLMACALRLAGNQLGRVAGTGPKVSLLVVVAVLAAVAASLAWWRGPVVMDEAGNLAGQLRASLQRVWEWLADAGWWPQARGALRNAAPSSLDDVGGYLGSITSSTFGVGGGLVLIVAGALFLAISPGTYVDGTVRLLPPRSRERARAVMAAVGGTLQYWFLGQLLDMLVVAVLIGAGLVVLGVPLALTLALFAGLLNFVPFIGALAGAVPAVLVASGQSSTQALWVAALFAAVQMLEGNVIAPLIQKRTVALPPALTIFSQALLGTLFGIMGVILATPAMAALMVLVRMTYVEGVLEGKAADGSGAAGPPGA
jgi:predicted PurR-regulated permease PerM